MAPGQGFAALTPDQRIENSRKAGQRAHEKGTAHEWTPAQAREAGRKGGRLSRGGRGKLQEDPVAQSPGPAAGPRAVSPAAGPDPAAAAGSADPGAFARRRTDRP